jgi:hypothetical protein
MLKHGASTDRVEYFGDIRMHALATPCGKHDHMKRVLHWILFYTI